MRDAEKHPEAAQVKRGASQFVGTLNAEQREMLGDLLRIPPFAVAGDGPREDLESRLQTALRNVKFSDIPAPAMRKGALLEQRLLSTAQAAAYLNVTRSTIYRLVYGGVLPVVRAFKYWKFDRADLDAFVAREKITL